jgi:hypothetical protein
MTSDQIKVIKDQCNYWKGFKQTVVLQCKEDRMPLTPELIKINGDHLQQQIFI